uniref:Uncharacterized protein n=1 Tax=Pfiesteria piscicida TaxID=71001 RepID=A3E3R8_PFIPI|nr:unknown [Pfiesteria piscicida]
MGGGQKDAPNAAPCAAVLALEGFFLAACGCYGSWMQNWRPGTMHSAYSGLGAMVVLLLCAGMTVSGAHLVYKIGVHLALVFQAVFVLVFTIQSYRSYNVPEKADRHTLFIVMDIGSVVGLALMIALKPKKGKESVA